MLSARFSSLLLVVSLALAPACSRSSPDVDADVGPVDAGDPDMAEQACAASTVCAPRTCIDGLATAEALCDGAGACVPPASVSCSPYVCGTDACLTACVTIADCATGAYCDPSGACVPTKPLGALCMESDECTSGHCADGVCCNTACEGACEACTAALGAAVDGTCAPVARGIQGPNCPETEYCDGTTTSCVAACTDASTPLLRRPIDIIMLVDNSASMTNEIVAFQDAIDTSFASILATAGLDYRIILVTRHGNATTTQSVCIGPPLSGATSCMPPPAKPTNGTRFFHYSVEIGSTNEWCKTLTTFSTADEFDSASTGWQTWLRSASFKELILVTDDRANCTNGTTTYNDTTASDGLTSATAFRSALFALSPAQFGSATVPNFQAHAIVGVPAPTTATGWLPTDPIQTTYCSTAASVGYGHQSLATISGGMRYSVCKTDSYGAYFSDLAQRFIITECRYAIPTPAPGATVDRDTLSTQTTIGGTATFPPRVADKASCVGDGFYVLGDSVVLCPSTCAAVAADTNAEVRVRYLCE